MVFCFVQFASSTLQIYAGSFFAIPVIRWFFIQRTNARIEKRNKAREERARALELPNLSLRRKVNMMACFSTFSCYSFPLWPGVDVAKNSTSFYCDAIRRMASGVENTAIKSILLLGIPFFMLMCTGTLHSFVNFVFHVPAFECQGHGPKNLYQ